jgi:hypothetical protein
MDSIKERQFYKPEPCIPLFNNSVEGVPSCFVKHILHLPYGTEDFSENNIYGYT